jgi:hypothetical protein
MAHLLAEGHVFDGGFHLMLAAALPARAGMVKKLNPSVFSPLSA